MSIGSWDPEAAQPEGNFQIDPNILDGFLALEPQQLEQLATTLPTELQQQQAPLMLLDKASWMTATENYSDEQIIALMRFFTLAEKLPGWEAGDKSPVIWLGKVLKKRGTGINRELVIWIKEHSDNQFLPHGSLL